MKNQDVIRAWKDEEYRLSLSEAERALLPAHPVGLIELTDAEMYAVAGGSGEQSVTAAGDPCGSTFCNNNCGGSGGTGGGGGGCCPGHHQPGTLRG